jgi:hypothetical protein
MNFSRFSRHFPLVAAAGCLAALLVPSRVQANVYATQVRLNGGTANLVGSSAGPANISYLLNEPADGGVNVQVWSGSNIVRTISAAPGAAGTLKGTNLIVWDGQLDGNVTAGLGLYRISVTASNIGYPDWTQLTSDTNAETFVWQGRGIAVNQNQHSPYYGRIFVANAGFGPGSLPGDQVGILKFEPDFSYAVEGAFSEGGHNWGGGLVSPWKIEVSQDDAVYVNDFIGRHGEFYRFDQTISPESLLQVTRPENLPDSGNASLGGFAIVGSGSSTALWAADERDPGTVGVVRFGLGSAGQAAPNDTGTVMVRAGGSLTENPADVALDAAGNIYVVQSVSSQFAPAPRVLKFAAFDPSTNNGLGTLVADWEIGAANVNFGNATGIAVDPSGTYVAVSFGGTTTATGNTSIFYASNGVFLASVDLGLSISGQAEHVDTDCAWDAAGNLYYIDNYSGVWRALSPPGTNGATTFAIGAVEVTGPSDSLRILDISLLNGTVTIFFQGATTDSATAFKLFSSTDPATGYTREPGPIITQLVPGKFQASVPASGNQRFYRVQR